jgi:hypothetical protein
VILLVRAAFTVTLRCAGQERTGVQEIRRQAFPAVTLRCACLSSRCAAKSELGGQELDVHTTAEGRRDRRPDRNEPSGRCSPRGAISQVELWQCQTKGPPELLISCPLLARETQRVSEYR